MTKMTTSKGELEARIKLQDVEIKLLQDRYAADQAALAALFVEVETLLKEVPESDEMFKVFITFIPSIACSLNPQVAEEKLQQCTEQLMECYKSTEPLTKHWQTEIDAIKKEYQNSNSP
jgi:hypothetical protein